MLNSLANYLLRSSVSDHSESRDDINVGNINNYLTQTRLKQVEVEENDWILIDQTVEGATSMDESWYVTPPACFTKASPVHVETSPLEDLLIEHPSMSVYRTAKHPIVPDTSVLTPITFEEIGESTIHVSASNIPCVFSQRTHKQTGNISNIVNAPRKREYRMTNNDKNIDIVQLRSAQKIQEKRVTQTSKRNRLERGNKVREFSSVKGKQPRRQDRLRLRNSGANNDRKC
ncbi:tumor protein p53-inducible nuclear protein 2 isoform X2 [Leptopilina boulardi]|nr:tumor protein p53-inducible nuclear protein 2 isoform X2 [Leptopilina boulardi]